MKRLGDVYKEICSFDNLYLAYRNAKKGKGWYREIQMIEERPYYYLAALKWELQNHLYKTSDYTSFIKHEASLNKDRKIYKLPFFPDRIVQWAIMQVIAPEILKNLISDTYSAIPDRGIHKAFYKIRDVVDYHPEEMTFCFKGDGKKYYPSVDHEILKAKFRRKWKDPELLKVLDEIIDSISTCPATEENVLYYKKVHGCDPVIIVGSDGELYIEGIGLPIGNYFSQWAGNFYFSALDHYIKEVLHVKHYYRYMDDICIFSDSKEELHDIMIKVSEFMDKEMHIRLKENWQIFPSYDRGIDFVGYRIFEDYTLLRKSTYKAMRKKMSYIKTKVESGHMMNYSEWCSINSYEGWLKHANCKKLTDKYITPLKPYADNYYNNVIKRKAAA